MGDRGFFHEETFSLLGFLARATQDIKLGLGVTNPYTRNPALLAMASATLDRPGQQQIPKLRPVVVKVCRPAAEVVNKSVFLGRIR